jgi:hypothetical protein
MPWFTNSWPTWNRTPADFAPVSLGLSDTTWYRREVIIAPDGVQPWYLCETYMCFAWCSRPEIFELSEFFYGPRANQALQL